MSRRSTKRARKQPRFVLYLTTYLMYPISLHARKPFYLREVVFRKHMDTWVFVCSWNVYGFRGKMESERRKSERGSIVQYG